MELTPIIEESFAQYSGAVLQSRALVDARDFLKPSARQIFYCMKTDKFTADKPFKKTLKAVGSAMRMYIHGDSSCVGVIMRAGQPFSMRYPLVEVDGAYGTLAESGNWSAPRYTSARLSPLAEYLFKDIEKNTIKEWRDNYDDTEQYPAVLTGKGYFNIVNGTSGIGVAASSSCPQFNIKDVNNALITLLQNPDCDFDEIYCAPDFATGAILLNADEVKESIKNGIGKACKLRSVIEYDESENCLIVKEIPYSVYTGTIRGELDRILNEGLCPGIERYNDLTGSTPNIKIYLTKKANVSKVLQILYKETSLQHHFSINMTMLDNGRFPRVFGWRELLQAHIDHEKVVYRRGYEYDLAKAEARLHIVEGILIALARIEEVIEVIKKSSSTADANKNLQANFLLDEIQAKAILDIKLSRLAHMEVEKFEKEAEELTAKIDGLRYILDNEEEFDKQLIKGWQDVASKFGDERRTQIMNLTINEETDEPIEKKQMVVHLTNLNTLYAYEDTTLITARRGRGMKVKLGNNEQIIQTVKDSNLNNLLLFSSLGKVYNLALSNLTLDCRTPISTILELAPDETITYIVSDTDKSQGEEVLFVTQKGTVKKTLLREYNIKRTKGVSAIKLTDGDFIKRVMIVNNKDNLAITTKNGYVVIFPLTEINTQGRNTIGVRGITLRPGDEVCDACVIRKDAKELISVTESGQVKKTDLDEFSVTSRAAKGAIIHKLNDGDKLAGFAPVREDSKTVSVASTGAIIKISLNEIPTTSRATVGVKSINLKDEQYVTGLIVE